MLSEALLLSSWHLLFDLPPKVPLSTLTVAIMESFWEVCLNLSRARLLNFLQVATSLEDTKLFDLLFQIPAFQDGMELIRGFPVLNSYSTKRHLLETLLSD